VWEIPLDGGLAKLVKRADKGFFHQGDWSPNDTRLIAACGEVKTNLVLISAFK
jgi:hypothetical protein